MSRARGSRRFVPKNRGKTLDVSRILIGSARTETRLDGSWHVRTQSAVAAVKEYRCPGCGLTISPGTAHLVAWRADGLFGAEDDLADRRHWHNHCWRIKR